MNADKGSIVKQSGNDVEGCRSEKVLVQPNTRVFLQYSINAVKPARCKRYFYITNRNKRSVFLLTDQFVIEEKWRGGQGGQGAVAPPPQ